MAHAPNRSQNAELAEGATDGSHKKLPMNRSNVQFPSNPGDERRQMSWRYGFEDAYGKIDPTTGHPARRAYDDHG